MAPRVLLYEYATAGGAWDDWHDEDLVAALRNEGHAMFRALAGDLIAAGFQVQSLSGDHDRHEWAVEHHITSHLVLHQQQRREAFDRRLDGCDAALIIAPELQNILQQLTARAEASQAKLLSAGSEFVALAADKHATAEFLRAAGVAAAAGVIRDIGDRQVPPWPGPWVAKPLDGAGSMGVQLHSQWEAIARQRRRWEPYYAGVAASVAALCGSAGRFLLEPCGQRLAGSGRFDYLGGWLPLDEPLRQRAMSLARRAVDALPPVHGYVGLDMVLGRDSQGREDVVIEVNPRLTTSYIGLRRASRENLAAAWWQAICGQTPVFVFDTSRVEFSADGVVGEQLAV